MNRILSALLLVGTGGCASDQPEQRVIHRDSAGTTITGSLAPAWSEGEGWTVTTAPIVDLAVTGEGPEHEFFDAVDATILSDGSIAVADDGSDEVRIFSADGVYLRTLGRAGDGPGEFRRLTQVIALPGDSIWAYDYWQSRITVFAPDGSLARILGLAGAYRPRPLFPLTTGGFVGRSMDYTGFRDRPGLFRFPSPIVRLGEDGSVIDTLTTIPGPETVVFSRGDGPALWEKTGHLAVRGDAIYLGSADSLQYQIRAPDGRLIQRVRVRGYDLGLESEEIEAEREALLEDAPAEVVPIIQEILERQPERSRRPAYSTLVVDLEGYVWLGAYKGRHEEAEPREWQVFDPEGEWLGGVVLPPGFEVFRIGDDWILGKRRDELDVEHIQLLRLSRGRAPVELKNGRVRSRDPDAEGLRLQTRLSLGNPHTGLYSNGEVESRRWPGLFPHQRSSRCDESWS